MGLHLVWEGRGHMRPPPNTHTQATYPLSGIKHDEIKRVSTQDAIDDCERVTGCHGVQQ